MDTQYPPMRYLYVLFVLEYKLNCYNRQQPTLSKVYNFTREVGMLHFLEIVPYMNVTLIWNEDSGTAPKESFWISCNRSNK